MPHFRPRDGASTSAYHYAYSHYQVFLLPRLPRVDKPTGGIGHQSHSLSPRNVTHLPYNINPPSTKATYFCNNKRLQFILSLKTPVDQQHLKSSKHTPPSILFYSNNNSSSGEIQTQFEPRTPCTKVTHARMGNGEQMGD